VRAAGSSKGNREIGSDGASPSRPALPTHAGSGFPFVSGANQMMTIPTT
jgi:hypothetical protein